MDLNKYNVMIHRLGMVALCVAAFAWGWNDDTIKKYDKLRRK